VLKNSNPDEFKKTFSLKKKILFGLGFFPRGKAKAPKYVRTYEPITENDLVLMVQSAKKSVEEIPSLHPDHFITHPLFGDLKLKETIYFIKLHTKHHLKIIEDIVNK
jgi:prephenate dehydrogenase